MRSHRRFCVWFGKRFFVALAAAEFTGAIGWAIRQRGRIHAVLTTATVTARRAIAAAVEVEAVTRLGCRNVITTGQVVRHATVRAKPRADTKRV